MVFSDGFFSVLVAFVNDKKKVRFDAPLVAVSFGGKVRKPKVSTTWEPFLAACEAKGWRVKKYKCAGVKGGKTAHFYRVSGKLTK